MARRPKLTACSVLESSRASLCVGVRLLGGNVSSREETYEIRPTVIVARVMAVCANESEIRPRHLCNA